jgi:predicted enzyme related to lactoylglutathione lyase
MALTLNSRIVLGITVDDLESSVAQVAEIGGDIIMPLTNNG